MYTTKLLEKPLHGQDVGVFDPSGKMVGQFYRNYDSFSESTFYPFERDGKWYGLYSPSYIALSVMQIHENRIEYIGGEDQSNSSGFCPVEVYIPRYQWWFTQGIKDQAELDKYPKQNHSWLVKDRWQKEYDVVDSCFDESDEAERDQTEPGRFMGMEPDRKIYYEDFAFVAGCVWGDDSSWKIEIRDISEAHNGIIKSIDDWGYYEMPPGLDLKKSIRLDAFDQYDKADPTSLNIGLAVQKTLRYNTKNKTIFDFDNPEDVKVCLKL